MFGMPLVIVLLLLIAMMGVAIYNRLVGLRNQLKNAFAQIEVQLKRRHDLIPNLIEVAKGYLSHERTTLEAVIAARNQAAGALARAGATNDASAVQALAGAEGALQGALGRFFALAEAYPDLKADRTMGQLSEELTSTENRVAFARQAYNDAVMIYNTARETFPAVLFSGSLGFTSASPLEIPGTAHHAVPRVQFETEGTR